MNAWLQAGCLNAHPTLGVVELQADLPCALDLWQAPNADAFRRLLEAKYDGKALPEERPATMSPVKSIRHGVELLTSDDLQWRSLSGSFKLNINRMDLIIMIIGTSPRFVPYS